MRRLEEMFGNLFLVRSWQDLNRNLFAAMKLERTMMFSRTTDGGQTWSSPQAIGPSQTTDTQFLCTLNVLRDGKRLDLPTKLR